MLRQHQCSDDHINVEKTDLALYDAIMRSDLNEVRHLFQQTKRNLNEPFLVVRHKDHDFMDPINLVSGWGTVVMLKFLIESGCDVNGKGKILKRTPVHMAVLNNNISCLQLLITAQAKLDLHDIFGNSPCHYAAELGYHDMLDIMIRIGTQVNSQDITAKTPLMKAVRNNRMESVIRLIRANADLNITDNNNELALHFAVRNGNIDLLDTLVSSGSLIDVQNKWGRTPLIESVYYNNREIVQHLLAAGCNVNKRLIKTGETALHIAIRKKYGQVAEKILEYILLSPAHTMTMLTSYDLDMSSYTCLFESEYRRNVTLFHMAAEKRYFKTCQLLASLGQADQGFRSQFQSYAENLDITETDRKSVLTVLEFMKCVTSLKQACRNVIRRSIGHDLSNRVSSLPIPAILRNYLLLEGEQALF